MIAFQPTGPIKSFISDTSAPTSVQSISQNGVQTSQQYILTNTDSTNDSIVAWSTISDADAKLKAVVASGYGDCYYLMHSTQVVITAPDRAFFTGIGGGTATIKVQCGIGN